MPPPQTPPIEACASLVIPTTVTFDEAKNTVGWTAGTERVLAVDGAELLIRVARLHVLAKAEQVAEVRALVKEFGPMGLCQRHGLPAGHFPRRAAAVVRQDLDDRLGARSRAQRAWHEWRACTESGRAFVPLGTKRGIVGFERIEDWLRISREATALIAMGAWLRRVQEARRRTKTQGATLSQPTPPMLTEIEALARLLPAPLDLVAPWSDASDPEGRRRVLTRDGLTDRPIGSADEAEDLIAYEALLEASKELWLHPRSQVARVNEVAQRLQRIAVQALQAWLDEGDLSIRLVPDENSGLMRMRWGNGALFSIVAMQMAMTYGGINALAVCDACRRTYRPNPWVRVGSHAYCDACREDKKAHQNLRQQMSRLTRPAT